MSFLKLMRLSEPVVHQAPSMDLETSAIGQSTMVTDAVGLSPHGAQLFRGVEEGAEGNTYYSMTRTMSFLDSKAS